MPTLQYTKKLLVQQYPTRIALHWYVIPVTLIIPLPQQNTWDLKPFP